MAEKSRKRKPRRFRQVKVGSSPGVLLSHEGAVASTMTTMAYDDADLHEDVVSNVEKIPGWIKKYGVTWLNINGLADIALLEATGEMLGLHRLALEDVVTIPQRPKMEQYPDHLFIVVQVPGPDGDSQSEQVSLFLGRKYLLTFQEREGDPFDPVRNRIREGRPRLRHGGPDYLCYALLDAAVDAYFPVLERIGEDLERLEQSILADPKQAVVNDLHMLKRDLTTFRRHVWPLRELFSSLLRDENDFVREDTKPYLRDCYDHTIQLMDLVESYRDISSGLIDLYLSTVSNRMNEVMKVLTIMSTIFIPLSFIAGLYGMNFDTGSRWNLPELGWKYGYPFALGLMGVLAGGLLIYFRRRGWLGRGDD